MNRLSVIAVMFALLVPGGQGALGQGGHDLFQQGLVAERAEGNLDKAMELYEQVVKEFPEDRPLVAKTLLQLGACYEKLGRQDARRVYEQVVREFADQPEPVRIASQHLRHLETGTTGNGPDYRLILGEKLENERIVERTFSSSGHRVLVRLEGNQGQLHIVDHGTGVVRPLLEDLGSWQHVDWGQWSPDDKWIAVTLSKTVGPESDGKRKSAIFVVSPDGGRLRQVGAEITEWISGLYWTADSLHLSYFVHGDGLHTLTLDGEEIRFIPHDAVPFGVGSRDCSYSPNGRWIASRIKKDLATTGERGADICILPAEGGETRRLTSLPGASFFPTWAPDGRALYFESAADGGVNIWRLPMDPEAGHALGEPQQITFFKDVGLWWPKVHGDGTSISFSMARHERPSMRVAASSPPYTPHTLAAGANPLLSPDGRTVYYLSNKRGEETICAMPSDGGASRQLTEDHLRTLTKHAPMMDLSPDGKTLVFSVTPHAYEHSLVTLPTSGGRPEILVEKTETHIWGARWSPDGSQLAYIASNGLYVVGAAGGTPNEVAHWDDGWISVSLRWSPDGAFLAALGRDRDFGANPAVFVVPAAGGTLRQLTPFVEDKNGLEWHPDGDRLTYHVRGSQGHTQQAFLDGRPPSVLFDAPDIWDGIGAWAPDGRRFFFIGDGTLYAYDEASGESVLVEDPDFTVRSPPRWSRDGETMVWLRSKVAGTQSWMMEHVLPLTAAQASMPSP